MAVNCKKQSLIARFGALFFGMLALMLSACGPQTPTGLRLGPEAKVISVQEDASLKLADGAIARRAVVDMPNGAGASTEALKRDALGRKVRLYFDGAERDSRGAISAHIFVRNEAGQWIRMQGALVEAGLERVHPQATDREGAL